MADEEAVNDSGRLHVNSGISQTHSTRFFINLRLNSLFAKLWVFHLNCLTEWNKKSPVMFTV